MSLILDYIYTGSATVLSNTLPEFLSIAKLLKLKLNYDYPASPKPTDELSSKCKYNCCLNSLDNSRKQVSQEDVFSTGKMSRTKKELFNKVFPSPWSQRVAPVLGDPRLDCHVTADLIVSEKIYILYKP